MQVDSKPPINSEAVLSDLQRMLEAAFTKGYQEGYKRGFERGVAAMGEGN